MSNVDDRHTSIPYFRYLFWVLGATIFLYLYKIILLEVVLPGLMPYSFWNLQSFLEIHPQAFFRYMIAAYLAGLLILGFENIRSFAANRTIASIVSTVLTVMILANLHGEPFTNGYRYYTVILLSAALASQAEPIGERISVALLLSLIFSFGYWGVKWGDMAPILSNYFWFWAFEFAVSSVLFAECFYRVRSIYGPKSKHTSEIEPCEDISKTLSEGG